jgi:hypothetical protein
MKDMPLRLAGAWLLWAAAALAQSQPPKAGPVAVFPAAQIKPGLKAVAWTVFEGTEAEAVPIEIIGLWKNAWGPKQDIILGKMGGRAARTNVAGGMSGSPVYIDGKLAGAVALRLSVFSPDAICGITPIELMLEINEFDKTKLAGAARPGLPVPGEFPVAAAAGAQPLMVPIESPLTLSGFTPETLREFQPWFQQLGVKAVLGGGGGSSSYETKPARDWKDSLRPGQPIAGVLVSGDMSVTGLGTVTYNDGRRVLGFGHPFFNLGPVDMPMARGEILMVLASQFAPNKFGNAAEVVGALKQDRHSGIMGVLGVEAPTIPVTMKVRSLGDSGSVLKQKDFRFNVFVQQKWTPFLMMLTLFNSIQGLNDFSEDATYRFSGSIDVGGHRRLTLNTMQAPSDLPIPAPMLLANWWGDKFSRMFGNTVETPHLKSVTLEVDLIPERRTASIEQAWASLAEASPGQTVEVKAFLRPYRGDRMERTFQLKVPPTAARGEHRILVSDAETLNRLQMAAASLNRSLDLPQTLSVIEQERSNQRLYVSLVQPRSTVYFEDKALPNLPGSIASVLQAGRSSARPVIATSETAAEQLSLPMDHVVQGSTSVKINIK